MRAVSGPLQPPLPRPGPHAWERRALWLLLGIPLLHVALLFQVRHAPHSDLGIATQLLRVLGAIGAIVIIGRVAARQRRWRRRWAWIGIGLALSFSTSFGLLRILGDPQAIAPITAVLPILIYACGLTGAALAIEQRTWWLGGPLRILLDGVVVALAALVLLRTVLPTVFHPLAWNPLVGLTLPYLALDMGILFAIGAGLGRMRTAQERPLLVFVGLSFLCLLLADTLYLGLAWAPWGRQQTWLITPLFTLQTILLACAAVADRPPAAADPAEPPLQPLPEWLIWTLVPSGAALCALLAASLLPPGAPLLIGGLFGVAMLHLGVSIADYRRVLTNLAASRQQVQQINDALQQSNQQLQASLCQVEELAIEQERVRVAREIHDGLGHGLSTIQVHLAVSDRALATDPAAAHAALRIARGEVRKAQHELRRAVQALVARGPTSTLADLLGDAVRDCQLAGLPVNWCCEGTIRPLPGPVTHMLYRIAQESLTNIRLHAQTTRAQVTLRYADEQVTLAIVDDGVGLPADRPHPGQGLLNIRERAALIGGRLTLESAPGAGVRICVEVPG